MNHYSSWWDDTVTIFNKVVDKANNGQIKWYRYVIHDCFYSHTLDRVMIGHTAVASNISTCRIRVTDAFVEPSVWMKLQDDERANHFTLRMGDIIVAGEVDFEIDEYVKGQRSSDLVQEYSEWPGCFTIETVNINVGGGRGNEHYHVKGT